MLQQVKSKLVVYNNFIIILFPAKSHFPLCTEIVTHVCMYVRPSYWEETTLKLSLNTKGRTYDRQVTQRNFLNPSIWESSLTDVTWLDIAGYVPKYTWPVEIHQDSVRSFLYSLMTPQEWLMGDFHHLTTEFLGKNYTCTCRIGLFPSTLGDLQCIFTIQDWICCEESCYRSILSWRGRSIFM